MLLKQYQTQAKQFAMYSNDMYPIASLMVESAELADLFIKPKLRGDIKPIDRKEVISEAGDVLWNLANLLSDQGIDLDEVAKYNIEKLASRMARGVVKGDGGDR